MRKVIACTVACLLFNFAFCQQTASPVSYSNQGDVYTQNFDALPNNGNFGFTGKGPFNFDAQPINAVTLKGWQFFMAGGTGINAGFLVSAGSSTTNGVQSLGTAGSAERALGSLSTASGIYAFGVLFTNNTAIRLNRITVSFTAEQWRKGGSGNRNNWSFHYKTGALNNIDAADLIADTHLNFGSLITTTGTASLNGNLPENRQAITYTITGIDWKPGEQLLLRWDDADEPGSDDACGIDDFRFTAEQVEDFPSIVNLPATLTGNKPSRLNALVNDNNAITDIVFEYDTNIDFTDPKPIVPTPDRLVPASGNTPTYAILPELLPGTTYYYRVIAMNRNGTTTSSPIEFINPVTVPALTTSAAGIQGVSAVSLGGNIISNGGAVITERGIVWSTNSEPALPLNKIIVAGTSSSFSQTAASLPQGATLYARAYAINSAGVGYGSSISFTTPTTISSFSPLSPTLTNAQRVIFSLKKLHAAHS